MNIWLVTTGEPLLTDGDFTRLLRTGMLAEALVKRGHHVVFWSSTYDHMAKTKRATRTTTISINPNYELCLLDAMRYRKNISLRRIWHNRATAKRFMEQALLRKKPDIIVCAYPTIELSSASVAYGKKHDVPVILDIRDLWPDIFYDAVPRLLRPFASVILGRFDRQASNALRGATAVTGITNAFVKWGLEKAGLTHNPATSPAFHLGYSAEIPSEEDILRAGEYWDALGIHANKKLFVACMPGNLGFTAEIDVLVRAMDHMPLSIRHQFRIVICGTGMAHQYLKDLGKDHPQIIFPGWVDQVKIWVLLRRSSVGVIPYLSSKGFQHSMPNKVGEYLSAGLPILSSVQGVLSRFLDENRCGITYPNRDPATLAMTLIDLQQNPSEFARLSTCAKDAYLREFDAELVMGKYCEYIEKLGAQGSECNGPAG